MRDAQTVLHAKGLHPLNIERTDVQPGDRYFVGHRVIRMGDPEPAVAHIEDDDAPDCTAVQRAPIWHFALAGAGIGLTILYGLGIIPVWAILVPLLCGAVAWGWGR